MGWDPDGWPSFLHCLWSIWRLCQGLSQTDDYSLIVRQLLTSALFHCSVLGPLAWLRGNRLETPSGSVKNLIGDVVPGSYVPLLSPPTPFFNQCTHNEFCPTFPSNVRKLNSSTNLKLSLTNTQLKCFKNKNKTVYLVPKHLSQCIQ